MAPLTVALAVICAALASGTVVWAVMTIGQLRRRIEQLEQAKPTPDPRWVDSMKLDHRQQLVSIAALVKLSARDQLDALSRMSPEMLQDVIREFAPHLFQREGIQ